MRDFQRQGLQCARDPYQHEHVINIPKARSRMKYMQKHTVTLLLHPEVGSTLYFKFTIVHIQSFSMIY